MTHAERVARNQEFARVLAAVAACPERGSVLPVSQQPGCGCAEKSQCRAGKGRDPGKVTTTDCVECRFGELGLGRRTPQRVERSGRAPGDPVRVGLLCPCLVLGGAEQWMVDLVKSVDRTRIEWVGVGTLGGEVHAARCEQFESLSVPIHRGRDASRAMVARCDVLVSWLADDVASLFAGVDPKPVTVAVSHTCSNPPWSAQFYTSEAADHVAAVSRIALDEVQAERREGAAIIHNAVDPDRLIARRTRAETRAAWRVPPEARVTGYYGRLVNWQKDVDAMVRQAWHQPDDTWTVIVGEGCEREALESAAGRVPRLVVPAGDSDAGSVLGAFDALVSPSHYETWGLSICEALWVGIPVVGTRCGVEEIHPGLVRAIPFSASGEAIALAILQDRIDPAGTLRRVERARDWARANLTLERFGREWTDLICACAPAAVS